MAKAYRVFFALQFGVGLCIAFPLSINAQTVAPSQVTPQTMRPSLPSVDDRLRLPGAPQLTAPPQTAGLNFIVGRVVVQGTFLHLDIETLTLVATVEGRRITVTQVYELANALEQLYARAGYVLVRVTVPPQTLNDRGALRIVVTDGFIEQVQVDKVPDQVRALVAQRMASLVGRRRIKLFEIERRLLLAGDVPGLRLKSVLARGTTPGGASLLLEGTQKLVSLTTSVDNRLPASLGTWSYGANLALNSPFGMGEQFYASAESAGDLDGIFGSATPLRVLAAGAVLPLGLDGWMLNPEYTNSRSQPLLANGGLASIGQFERFALRTSYPLIRTRLETLSLNGGLEFINQSVALPLFGTDLNTDRYAAIRIGATYDTGLPWWGQGLQTSATFSKGVGGRNQADADASGIPLSRQRADPHFDKAVFDVRLIQPLPDAFRVDLIGRAQISFGDAMMLSEQFSLDSPQAVSAFPSGTFNVDEGFTLRSELSRPFAVNGFFGPLILSPYGFGSFGAGRLKNPTIVEQSTVRAAAVGAGLRSNIEMSGGYQGASLSVEIARQFSNVPDVEHAWRTNVSLSIRF
ncbi:MAG: ShlB/FhaC/HecB family hemolysin secretion/activation protein [Pseudolabrys sp.]|nr:ShlB/FhaC/HecB family hemolysin secretion/activation protein [Pseudolabrys sp.]